MKKQMSFLAAMKDYFGDRHGQTGAAAFMREIKELDDADRSWFRSQLSTVGYEIV